MKFRKLLKITSRSSSITNSFVQAIIPSFPPTAEERREALAVLGMSEERIECAYCGAAQTDWDHLRPLVRNKRPTGYVHEMRNLVPSCAKCNQSKSGREWREWMRSTARGSPATRKVADLEARMERLEAFETWGGVLPLPLPELAGSEHWDTYWGHLVTLEQAMVRAQEKADEVQAAIRRALEERTRPVAG